VRKGSRGGIDITGQPFGVWLVLERVENPGDKNLNVTHWRCVCQDCGIERIMTGTNLRMKRPSISCMHARMHMVKGRLVLEKLHKPNSGTKTPRATYDLGGQRFGSCPDFGLSGKKLGKGNGILSGCGTSVVFPAHSGLTGGLR